MAGTAGNLSLGLVDGSFWITASAFMIAAHAAGLPPEPSLPTPGAPG
jgi:hypothetical protein